MHQLRIAHDLKLNVIRAIDGHNVSSPKADTEVRESLPRSLQDNKRFALVGKLFRNLKDKVVQAKSCNKRKITSR
jgi:hypothetical protein